jgi:hypothetical protein
MKKRARERTKLKRLSKMMGLAVSKIAKVEIRDRYLENAEIV